MSGAGNGGSRPVSWRRGPPRGMLEQKGDGVMDQKKIGAFLKALRAEKGLTPGTAGREDAGVQQDGVPLGDRLQSARPERPGRDRGLLRRRTPGTSGRRKEAAYHAGTDKTGYPRHPADRGGVFRRGEPANHPQPERDGLAGGGVRLPYTARWSSLAWRRRAGRCIWRTLSLGAAFGILLGLALMTGPAGRLLFRLKRKLLGKDAAGTNEG